MRLKERQLEEKGVAFKAAYKKCFKCNKMRHFANDCRSKTNTSNKQICCFQCNKVGHIKKSCKEKFQTKAKKVCSICKKSNHTEKNCYFRKEKN